ncbi:YceD family protein [Marinibaculum pumilum]|uniref:YceD family protein n=1 Tax=Marinibaculum pumilum TaxID=1766165 RepID=A0ABV7KUQ0_9PROT
MDLDDLPEDGLAVDLRADEAECAAVARRLGLRRVAGLRLGGRLQRDYAIDGFRLAGELTAAVTQTCVVSLEPVEAEIRVPVQRAFVIAPPGEAVAEDGEIDPGAEDPPDAVPEGVAELGELATEELALALDPYPRKPGATWPDAGSAGAGAAGPDEGPGEGEQGQESPFAVLRHLKH